MESIRVGSKPYCKYLTRFEVTDTDIYTTELITTVKKITAEARGAGTIKHYGFVTYRFLSRLVCLWLAMEKTLAYYKICSFIVNYESVMFYITRSWGLYYKTFYGRSLQTFVMS